MRGAARDAARAPRHEHAADAGGLPVTGDWVLVHPGEGDGAAVIEQVLPRRTAMSRKVAGPRTRGAGRRGQRRSRRGVLAVRRCQPAAARARADPGLGVRGAARGRRDQVRPDGVAGRDQDRDRLRGARRTGGARVVVRQHRHRRARRTARARPYGRRRGAVRRRQVHARERAARCRQPGHAGDPVGRQGPSHRRPHVSWCSCQVARCCWTRPGCARSRSGPAGRDRCGVRRHRRARGTVPVP